MDRPKCLTACTTNVNREYRWIYRAAWVIIVVMLVFLVKDLAYGQTSMPIITYVDKYGHETLAPIVTNDNPVGTATPSAPAKPKLAEPYWNTQQWIDNAASDPDPGGFNNSQGWKRKVKPTPDQWQKQENPANLKLGEGEATCNWRFIEGKETITAKVGTDPIVVSNCDWKFVDDNGQLIHSNPDADSGQLYQAGPVTPKVLMLTNTQLPLTKFVSSNGRTLVALYANGCLLIGEELSCPDTGVKIPASEIK